MGVNVGAQFDLYLCATAFPAATADICTGKVRTFTGLCVSSGSPGSGNAVLFHISQVVLIAELPRVHTHFQVISLSVIFSDFVPVFLAIGYLW